MVKSRFALDSDEERDDFERRYISEGFAWRTLNEGEDPFSPFINPDITPLCLILHGRFPHLLVQFLRLTRLHITQLAINSLHIIMGVVKINRRFHIQLGLNEIKYCYGMSIHEGRYNLIVGRNLAKG